MNRRRTDQDNPAYKPARKLHRRAEDKARQEALNSLQELSLEDTRELLQSLRVNQSELEMQNEELRRTQHELAASRSRYFELYDLAPVGYLTLCEDGHILEANLTVANMLGLNRKSLIKKPISRFIFHDDQDTYYLHRKKIFEASEVQIWEMRLLRADKSHFWARLQAAPAQNGEYWITLNDISNQKHAEDELRRSEESLKYQNGLFSTLLKNIPMGVFMVEAPSGKPLVANDSALRILGRGILPDANKHNLSEVYKAFKVGTSISYPVKEMPITLGMCGETSYVDDLMIMRPDGTKAVLEIFGSPVLDDDGRICASLVSFSDITERKQAEQALQARLRISEYALGHSLEELLIKFLDEAEALTESQIGFLHFVDPDQVNLSLQTWSSNTRTNYFAAEGLCQHNPLESAGVWADCIREKRALIHNNYQSLTGRKGLPPGHAPVQRELVVPIFSNQLIVAVLGVGNKLTDYTAHEMMILERLANLAWEIIKRKKLEESLKAFELKYSRLFKSMMDAYCCVDMNGRIIESNASFQKMTGYSAEELASLTYVQLTPDRWHGYEKEIVENQVIVNGYSDSYQKEYRRKDGSIIDVELQTFLLKDDFGKPVGMWAIIRNITDRKLIEKKLWQAKEAAEAASHAKSDFLATMSHEIRTPLSAMLGNVELLEGSQLTPQQREYLNDCKSASRMLLQVINDVLDFSKIEVGKLELVNESFSVASMALQLVRIFSASARHKSLELTLSLADDLPAYIFCDQQRLRQIISNLLSNAIKFTEQGRVSLEFYRQQSLPAACQHQAVLCIVVRDTGVGIPPDKQEIIFDSFTQVENFSTRTTAGTGLGLPICRRLLELMDGTVTVSSLPGEGSVFTITLPVTISRSQPEIQPVTEAEIPAQGKFAPRKILFADDDKMGRTVAQKLLQRRGHKVTAVENGEALLNALKGEEFEIVLTDISMPDMDGTEVARIIRAGKRPGINSHVPIIAMTAHAFLEDREQFMSSGINGYIAKPVNLEELLKLIDELCSRSEQ